MTKKDYNLIASVIRKWHRGLGAQEQCESIARAFASELLNTNPRFNTQKFIDACTKDGSNG